MTLSELIRALERKQSEIAGPDAELLAETRRHLLQLTLASSPAIVTRVDAAERVRELTRALAMDCTLTRDDSSAVGFSCAVLELNRALDSMREKPALLWAEFPLRQLPAVSS